MSPRLSTEQAKGFSDRHFKDRSFLEPMKKLVCRTRLSASLTNRT